ncbi:hypothetical protein SCA6_010937 [Theobroma cacao]
MTALIVLEAKAKQAVEKEKRKTEKDLEGENGGAGVYSANLRKNYILANDEWKEDILPEILDGHNVYDFIDPDILLRLEELEREEGLRQAEDEDAEFEMHEALAAIQKKKSLLIQQHRIKKSTAESRPTVPRKFDKNREFTTERMGRQLLDMGLDPSLAINRARSRSRGKKRERSLDRGDNDSGKAMDIDVDRPYKMPRMRFRSLSMSRSTSQLRPPSEVVPGEGFKDSVQKKRNKDARRGEAERVIPTLKPKHFFSGKRSIGKTQRRGQFMLSRKGVPNLVIYCCWESMLFLNFSGLDGAFAGDGSRWIIVFLLGQVLCTAAMII